MRAFGKLPLLALLLLPVVLLAQNADEAKIKQERRRLLIEQTLADLQNLKLGENRAIVYAKIGSLVWDADQKRARAFFQTAVNELMNAQAVAEAAPKSSTYQNDLLMGSSTRPTVLNAVASRDAELALDLMARSRPAAVVKALTLSSGKDSKITNAGNSAYLAQNEINLEQTFYRMAADQNPEKAAKLLQESLSKSVSSETLNLLKKLAEKDPDSATELGSRIADKLIQAKFSKDGQADYQTLQAVIAFLNEFIAPGNSATKSLKLDEGQMHQLGEKLITYFLGEGGSEAYYLAYSIMPIAEKLSPSSVEALKRVAKTSPRGDMGFQYDPDVQKLLSGETTPDKMLAEAKKYSSNWQRQIYQSAASKLVNAGNMPRAMEVLKENFLDDALEEALRNLNSQYANSLISTGNFTEAEQLIDQMPESSRASSLVNLANSLYPRNPGENKTLALAILNKARTLTGERPETSNDMYPLMQIISAYANIEPSEAFRLYESLVPQMNELTDAAAVINGFQGGSNIREGEYVLNQGNSFGFYGADFSMLSTFSKSDFDRTVKLIDSFNRREVRISLKLQLIETLN
ncbi:MAG: hypothetical protein ABI999_07435 [Acidobacteriota bacterium]